MPEKEKQKYLKKLLKLAKQKHGKIYPVKRYPFTINFKTSWLKSISIELNQVILWYNDTNDSTHIVYMEI